MAVAVCCSGANITAELGPTQQWLLTHQEELIKWFSLPAQQPVLEFLYVILTNFFDKGSPSYGVLNAVPGSKLFTMVSTAGKTDMG